MPDVEQAAEDWVWEKIRRGEIADFNALFGTLDPSKPDKLWNTDRKLGPGFLRKILFGQPGQGEVPIEGVRIVGAYLPAGQVLRSGRVRRDVWLDYCRVEDRLDFQSTIFEGRLSLAGSWIGQIAKAPSPSKAPSVDLSGSLIEQGLNFSAVTLEGQLNCDGLQVGGSLLMRAATLNGEVILRSAAVRGQLNMCGSSFADTVNCNSVKVGQHLLMSDDATFRGDVRLVTAKIEGQVAMVGSAFEKRVNGDSLRVGQALILGRGTIFKGEVNLRGAKIEGQVAMNGSAFENALNCDSLQVGQSLMMHECGIFGGYVNLAGARIDGGLDMSSSTFEMSVDGQNLQVGQNLFMRGATLKAPALFWFARVGGDLDLCGATLSGIDLTGARITQELRLAAQRATAAWKSDAVLRLRNTQVGALQDSPTAWPSLTDLEGFSYTHLGGFGARGRDDARDRSVRDWKKWLETDRVYSPRPYAQLASVLAGAGQRERANAILFAGRERERREAWREHRWPRWLWLSILFYLCGYGIGIYTFRVLFWIGVSALAGTLVLWFGVPEAHWKGLWWCFGASLDRLLPIIQLNKEFADFFNDPRHVIVPGWVTGVFAGLGIWGWIMGSFLIAALSGLTQRS